MPEDLFPNSEPRWSVRTIYRHQTAREKATKATLEVSRHELLFGTRVQDKRKGESGLESLREIAKFLNRRNLKPRDRVECAADAPSFDSYIKKCAP